MEAGRSQVQQVRDSVDIVEIISGYVPLKKTGANYKGLCPFHREKTPSFVVNPAKQIYHCFGCGEGGNVFDFIMKVENSSFREVLQKLAEKAGIKLRSFGNDKKEEFEKIFSLNKLAMDYFSKNLTEDKGGEALKYLFKRGLGKKEAMTFKLGYALPGWDNLVGYLKSKSVSFAEAKKAGLIAEKEEKDRYYDRFRNRIMFPIFNLEGKVIAFGGRALDEEGAKYLNSPETPVFSKRSSFYGIGPESAKRIREAGSVIIVEGYMDLLALRLFGFSNSLATLGTAFTLDHARVIKRFTDNIFLTFDPDEAGVNAIKKTLRPVLLHALNAKIILLPKGHDPDTYLRKEGASNFKKLMQGSENILDFYVKNYFEHEMTLVGKAKVLEELREIFNEIPNEFVRELTVRKISDLTGIKESMLKNAEKSSLYEKRRPSENPFPKHEILLTRFVLEDPKLMKEAQEAKAFDYFTSKELRDFVLGAMADVGKEGLKIGSLIDGLADQELKRRLVEVCIDEKDFGEETYKAFTNCMERIKSDYLKRKSVELLNEIMEAEKKGDDRRCKELLLEKKALMAKYRRQ